MVVGSITKSPRADGQRPGICLLQQRWSEECIWRHSRVRKARRTSGVSAGQSMPHWLGCRERGPDTLRVFSNWELILVIMPSAATKDSRDSTCAPTRTHRDDTDRAYMFWSLATSAAGSCACRVGGSSQVQPMSELLRQDCEL